MFEEEEADALKGVEFIDGVKFELGVEKPLLGSCPAAGGLCNDDPVGL